MIKAETMENIRPGNPFRSDLFHMGTTIGTNVVVMYVGHPKDHQKYLIVVNTKTGERVLIHFDENVDLTQANMIQSIKEEKGEVGGASFHTETVHPKTKEEVARDILYGKDVNRG